ncbi:MAG: glycosidase [Clostridia bacterium]|nr:glycosidase [Clostridia bacterium]
MAEQAKFVDNGPMLNAYPDSMGGRLGDIAALLARPALAGVFQSFYILPSVFNSDLDRGFSIVDYSLNKTLARPEDLAALKEQGLDLKLDFILNHASVLSREFQDVLQKGEDSEYKDFFIHWNRFWEGCGPLTEAGYIQPEPRYLEHMFFRKPGLPILMVRFPDGRDVPYWNTFYQEIRYKKADTQELMQALDLQYAEAVQLVSLLDPQIDSGKPSADFDLGPYTEYKDKVVAWLESNRRYLGQMDLDIRSPLVWDYYDRTLRQLADYGAKIVRLDAFAYAPKEPGAKNFLNEPGTWDVLARVQELADTYGLALLPEIHAQYGEKIYDVLADKGYMVYDFFLPGLVLYSFEKQNGAALAAWARELRDKKIRAVNMLGCHDGIPLLDLRGFLADEEIDTLIETLVARGGYVKNLHGQKGMYYQVNATYFSALGEDEQRLLLARALQLFMPGKPQVWYLDLFAGKNDHEGVAKAGPGGHKEINRTNLSAEAIDRALETSVVRRQLAMLRWRATCPAFGFDSELEVEDDGSRLVFTWTNGGHTAKLQADLSDYSFVISENNRVLEL